MSAIGNIKTIFKRELRSFFQSPIAYVCVVIFLLISSSLAFLFGGLIERGEASLTDSFFTFHPWIFMIVAPEGTRSGASQWKTGFYRIAEKAGVPIIVASADYKKKEIDFPLVVPASGDLEADLATILDCYAHVHPRHPEKLSAPIKALREKAGKAE